MSWATVTTLRVCTLVLALGCAKESTSTVDGAVLDDASDASTDGATSCASCTEVGKNCGMVPDGCGAMIDCGVCTVPGESCEGSGVPNLCGTADFGTTFHVRADGGDATQCTGRTDAAYPGSGTNQACAWKHPFHALPPNGTPRIAGGDRLIIANGSYMMGDGAPETASCSDPSGCTAATIPSGPDAARPTRIVGAGYQTGCTQKPELWGTQGTGTVLDLASSSNVVIDCLELTDHANCALDHSGGLACKETLPYGPWAWYGIYAADSERVTLRHLDIHGFAHDGIHAGRIKDWTLEDVRIAANGWAGWDGTVGANSSNTGTIRFKRTTIAWNGCSETYPGKQPVGCWGQSAGGYGDGLGMYYTAGDWIFEDSVISHNSSDGLDLLYHDGGGTITIERSRFEGNAGNQVKVRGNTFIRNSEVIANCGFFAGKPFTHDVDHCRANGNAFSITVDSGEQATLINNTVYSEGDCLINGRSDQCAGPSSIVSKNNIYVAGTDYSGGDRSCFLYTACPQVTISDTNDVVFNAKADFCPAGGNNLCVDPQLVSATPATFDGRLAATSPALDTGLPVGGEVPAVDITGKARPSGTGVDRGAYER